MPFSISATINVRFGPNFKLLYIKATIPFKECSVNYFRKVMIRAVALILLAYLQQNLLYWLTISLPPLIV